MVIHSWYPKLKNLVIFYVQEDVGVWAHCNCSFHMHLIYLGPVSCFHILSFLSLGLTVGSGCRVMAIRQKAFSFLRALRAQWLTGGLQSLMTVASSFTDMAGNVPFLKALSRHSTMWHLKKTLKEKKKRPVKFLCWMKWLRGKIKLRVWSSHSSQSTSR